MGFKRAIIDYWVPSLADFKRTEFEAHIHNHRSNRYEGQLVGLALLGNSGLVARLTPQAIVRAIRTCEQHEMFYFSSRDMARLLRKIDRIILLRYNQRAYRLRFGRELSLVLYIEAIGGSFTCDQCEAIREATQAMETPPDEFNLYGEGPDTIRIWWD